MWSSCPNTPTGSCGPSTVSERLLPSQTPSRSRHPSAGSLCRVPLPGPSAGSLCRGPLPPFLCRRSFAAVSLPPFLCRGPLPLSLRRRSSAAVPLMRSSAGVLCRGPLMRSSAALSQTPSSAAVPLPGRVSCVRQRAGASSASDGEAGRDSGVRKYKGHPERMPFVLSAGDAAA